MNGVWSVPGYSEVRELGSGASGRVVLAVHEGTGTAVAVKYLNDRMLENPVFVREFRAEAQLLGVLGSPYVVGLYEYVEAPGGAAIVMELVDGIPLNALLKQCGRTGTEAALVLLKGSLLGLADAHRAGVVHRDYKPANVLVAADGTSKLVDFGIATPLGTTPGAAGTPAYMAPEQWQGRPASPEADVYAATATFFECLTGRKPYDGQNFAELAVQHIEAPVPETEAPEPVRPLIRRGLAKAPEQRPENAEAFVAELEALALAAYGPQWEERGQRKLAALAALLPLLFPSAGVPAQGTTALATTVLPPPPGWAPGGRGLLAAGAALVLGLVAVLGYQAVGSEPGGAMALNAFATSSASAPGPGSPAPGPSPSASPTPTPTPTPAPSASPSASPSPSYTMPTPTLTPTPTPKPTWTVTKSPTPSPTPTPTSSPSVRISAVNVTSFRQTGPGTTEAAFSVDSDGAGPYTLVVEWFTGDTKGALTVPDGSQSIEFGAGSPGTRTLAHTFAQGAGCYWSVRATTKPAAANQSSVQSIYIRGCKPA
ncbi:serine/threonine-protein kinase [Streptomyces sp. NBC_01264]|uniref:serine/threonine-protein kinase n=1 Tax=Streptomyces sp. NBC_01264 TaxID=2903804 RepID=UPI00224F9CA9|nr:serine/threonine-protein kinase [Streptomyces sp. NBC_01264]MCX4776445.1 serine/threonine protein kinase [Streptomyces sp. NBC_01264]